MYPCPLISSYLRIHAGKLHRLMFIISFANAQSLYLIATFDEVQWPSLSLESQCLPRIHGIPGLLKYIYIIILISGRDTGQMLYPEFARGVSGRLARIETNNPRNLCSSKIHCYRAVSYDVT